MYYASACGLWAGCGLLVLACGRCALLVRDVSMAGFLLRMAGMVGMWVGGVPMV